MIRRPLAISLILSVFLFKTLAPAGQSRAETATPTPASAATLVAPLVAAYPDFIDRVEGDELVWKDGARMKIDDGRGAKDLDALLNAPDIKDMFVMPYTTGAGASQPATDFDPGRIRYIPLFEKMYGDCRKGQVMTNAVDVVWLPRKSGRKIKFSRINGAAAALQAVSNELDALPDAFLSYLTPPAGTYNCRPIAGTNRLSAHGLAIAIDISTAHAHYWKNSHPDADGHYAYQNTIPREIVEIFEKHGFIWGGRWYHYDTMHFEYRPELTGRPH